MEQLLTGVRPACVGMIAGVMVSLSLTNYQAAAGGVSLPAVGIGLLDLYLLLRVRMSVPKVIGLSALLGLLFLGPSRSEPGPGLRF